MRILELGEQHVPAVATLHGSLDSSPWNSDQWRAALANVCSGWVLLDTNDALVGYVVFQIAPPHAELLNLGIAQKLQGKGYGEALLRDALVRVAGTCEKCLLDVRRSNIPAIQLYLKMGFEPIAERRDYYPVAGGGREDALVMQRYIQDACNLTDESR